MHHPRSSFACCVGLALLWGCSGNPATAPSTQSGPTPTGEHPVSLATQALASYGGHQGPDGEQLIQDVHVGQTSAKAEISYGPPGNFRAQAQAQASHGSLSGSAVAAGREILYPHQTAHTSASFEETLTFTGATGPGTVVYKLSLSGTATGAGPVGANVYLRHGDDPDEELVEYLTLSGEFTSIPHAVNFDAPVSFRVVLLCDAQLPQGLKGESACRFTATVASIGVFDQEMRPIPGVMVRSASGATYPIARPVGNAR